MYTEVVLRYHAEKYPLMRPVDVIKLLYQGEFAGGHLIEEPDRSLKRLTDELSGIRQIGEISLTEPLGGNLVRVNLAAISENNISPEKLNDIFVKSANTVKGSIENYKAKLRLLYYLQEKHSLYRFSADELKTVLEEHAFLGFPTVSHSSEYNRAYRPAYRVVLKWFIK